MTSGRLFTSNDAFRDALPGLQAGDGFVGRLRIRPGEETFFQLLAGEGIRFFPSLKSQLLARSKCLQARFYHNLMVPGTRVLYHSHDLHRLMAQGEEGARHGWVSKEDRRDGGLGIHWWPDLEALYNAVTYGTLTFPLVVQPRLSDCLDYRVIILDDYVETYQRHSRANFRANITFGGTGRPVEPGERLLTLCRTAMTRGDFPYAHLDILETGDHHLYLMEINLRGGIHHARIDPATYRRRVETIHQRWLAGAGEGRTCR